MFGAELIRDTGPVYGLQVESSRREEAPANAPSEVPSTLAQSILNNPKAMGLLTLGFIAWSIGMALLGTHNLNPLEVAALCGGGGLMVAAGIRASLKETGDVAKESQVGQEAITHTPLTNKSLEAKQVVLELHKQLPKDVLRSVAIIALMAALCIGTPFFPGANAIKPLVFTAIAMTTLTSGYVIQNLWKMHRDTPAEKSVLYAEKLLLGIDQEIKEGEKVEGAHLLPPNLGDKQLTFEVFVKQEGKVRRSFMVTVDSMYEGAQNAKLEKREAYFAHAAASVLGFGIRQTGQQGIAPPIYQKIHEDKEEPAITFFGDMGHFDTLDQTNPGAGSKIKQLAGAVAIELEEYNTISDHKATIKNAPQIDNGVVTITFHHTFNAEDLRTHEKLGKRECMQTIRIPLEELTHSWDGGVPSDLLIHHQYLDPQTHVVSTKAPQLSGEKEKDLNPKSLQSAQDSRMPMNNIQGIDQAPQEIRENICTCAKAVEEEFKAKDYEVLTKDAAHPTRNNQNGFYLQPPELTQFTIGEDGRYEVTIKHQAKIMNPIGVAGVWTTRYQTITQTIKMPKEAFEKDWSQGIPEQTGKKEGLKIRLYYGELANEPPSVS